MFLGTTTDFNHGLYQSLRFGAILYDCGLNVNISVTVGDMLSCRVLIFTDCQDALTLILIKFPLPGLTTESGMQYKIIAVVLERRRRRSYERTF